MTVSQRRHYRVSGQDLDGIAVSMVIGKQSRKVDLLDISAAGAAIAFPDWSLVQVENLTTFKRGAASIQITSSSLSEPLDILCRIAHMQEVDAGVICGVAFLQRIDESINLDRTLLRIFNRRGAVRVESDEKQPIQVNISDRCGTLITQGLIRDLSLTGVGVSVSPKTVATLPAGTCVTVDFLLDGGHITIPAEVRFSREKNDTLPGGVVPVNIGVLGIEFEMEARTVPTTNRSLANWVMRRQREVQRVQRESARQILSV
jgi:c-di-GMP-binding flagellar brake protein YcgR